MLEREDLDQKYVGTCFDRQVRIDQWNQDKLREQTVLLLGVGGLGSVLMVNLLRLGIKKLIIVDYDVVDIHNLNRQIMFGSEDVGKSKVEMALKNSKHHNIANTQIETYHGDAVKNWSIIVEYAKQAQTIFNCIDYGDRFDVAVASLCMKLKIHLIMGGTFATMLTIDYINPLGGPCFLCSNDEAAKDSQIIQKINVDKILQVEDLSFLPKNNNPIGRSTIAVCCMCGEIMISHFLNYLFLSEENPYQTSRLIGYHNTFELIKFDVQVNKKCLFCGDPNYQEPPKQKVEESGKTVDIGVQCPQIEECSEIKQNQKIEQLQKSQN